MTYRNASYTLFGWDFQVNAAIFIFLKNLKDIDKVRLEGKLQDIEFIKKINPKFSRKLNLFIDMMIIRM